MQQKTIFNFVSTYQQVLKKVKFIIAPFFKYPDEKIGHWAIAVSI